VERGASKFLKTRWPGTESNLPPSAGTLSHADFPESADTAKSPNWRGRLPSLLLPVQQRCTAVAATGSNVGTALGGITAAVFRAMSLVAVESWPSSQEARYFREPMTLPECQDCRRALPKLPKPYCCLPLRRHSGWLSLAPLAVPIHMPGSAGLLAAPDLLGICGGAPPTVPNKDSRTPHSEGARVVQKWAGDGQLSALGCSERASASGATPVSPQAKMANRLLHPGWTGDRIQRTRPKCWT
jgi:hypothetical protein